LIDILSREHVKEEKGLNDFKFCTFVGRFWSDGGTSMVVKGLIYIPRSISHHFTKTSPMFFFVEVTLQIRLYGGLAMIDSERVL